jgi:phosphoglycolate phosphatase
MFRDTTIVFDLDGTLVDTAPDLTHALDHALARQGQPPVSAEMVRSLVGMGAMVMIEERLSRAGVTADLQSMLGDFLVHYEANIAAESRPFPGAVEVLNRLRHEGASSPFRPCRRRSHARSHDRR